MKIKKSWVLWIFFLFFIAGCSLFGSQTTSPTPASPASTISPGQTISAVPSLETVQVPITGSSPTPEPSIVPPTPLPPSNTPAPTQLPANSTPTANSTIPASPTVTQAAPQANPTATQAVETAAPSATATGTPATPSATPATTQAAQGGCEDKAAFYADVTIPDNTSFRQGDTFVKTWQIKNAGTCGWGPTYSLVFAAGDILNGPKSVPLPNANPGDLFNISVNMTAPANGGTYVSDWQFQRPDGTRFGVNSGGIDYIWAKIVVSYVIVGPTTTPNPSSATCNGDTDASYISQVLSLINGARADNNLPALTLNPKLSAAAQAHSKDMACNDFVDHTGSDGSTWYTRVKAQGYKYAYASENIYVGNPAFGGDPQGAFTWWMNSQIHRDNILSKKVTEIGIGYAFYDKSTYGGYYTVDFAHP